MPEKVVAYVLLNVSGGREYEIADEIRKVKGVTEAIVVYGEYDIVARIEADSMVMLDKAVSSLRRIEGVLRSITLLGLG